MASLFQIQKKLESIESRLERLSDLVWRKREDLLREGLISFEEFSSLERRQGVAVRLDSFREVRQCAETAEARLNAFLGLPETPDQKLKRLEREHAAFLERVAAAKESN